MNYFLTQDMPGRFERVTQIFLSGGGAGTLDLNSFISSSLRIPVQLMNPFFRINTKASRVGVDYIMSQGNLYGVAVGLALR